MKFQIFTEDMLRLLIKNSHIKKKITNLSDNISKALRDIFVTLGTGRTSWFNKEINDTISR
jgi:hypothetical protein